MHRLTDLRMPRPELAAADPERTVDRVTAVAHAAELEELASGFAHRLNQPLGAIAAFAQAGSRLLSRSHPLVDQAATIFREITRLALDAGADIRRIRMLYTLDAPAIDRCRLAELIGELEPFLALMAVSFHGTVAFELEPDLPEIRVDRTRIQYVLLSLVQNAFDAVDPACDSPLITVSAADDHAGVVVSVVNSGIAVPGSRDQELFHPFLATKTPGMGLSLAASRSIIEAHQGAIGFERLPSGGNRFWFRLPAALV